MGASVEPRQIRDITADTSPRRRALWRLAYALYLIVIVLGAVKLYDMYLVSRHRQVPQAELLPGDVMPNARNIPFDIYPYTGLQVESNLHVVGQDPLVAAGGEFDVKTGPHGFFVDFDLCNPPAKEPNEFRILLIGGSAAQGWGGRTNQDMFYSLLERGLSGALAGEGIRVRVINLAMAASVTYQNYIALNKWGHGLGADLILSYSGHNDLDVTTETDLPFRMNGVMGLVEASKAANNPPALQWLGRIFPGLVHYTQLGMAFRMLDLRRDCDDAARRYQEAFRGSNLYGAGLYEHALESIKRDFDGIAIMVALQPSLLYAQDPQYSALMGRLRADLGTYKNKDWYFVDVHEAFRRGGLYDAKKGMLVDATHLSNEGHRQVADLLIRELTPVVQSLGSRRGAK